MKTIRRILRVTVTTEETWVIHNPTPSADAWCSGCGRTAPMASVAQSAAIAEVGQAAIIRRLALDTVHYTETPDGKFLVCLNSLLS